MPIQFKTFGDCEDLLFCSRNPTEFVLNEICQQDACVFEDMIALMQYLLTIFFNPLGIRRCLC